MKHAPAPWTIDTHKVSNSNGQKDYVIIRILDAEGRLVTEMTDLSRTEQNMANAKLIAQAPLLLERLRLYAVASDENVSLAEARANADLIGRAE